MDSNAANEGVISMATSQVAVRVVLIHEDLTIARAAIRTLGLNIASEELRADQPRKCIFRLVPFSARGPQIVCGRFVLQIESAPFSARGRFMTLQTRCNRFFKQAVARRQQQK